MRKPRLRLVTPTTVNRTVTPRRRPNRDLRTREHLTPKEVEQLIDGTKRNRWSHRDATMILLAYRHGLRASELLDLRWEQVDLDHAVLHVRRVKAGTPEHASVDWQGNAGTPKASTGSRREPLCIRK